MAEISKITLPSGNTYEIKDAAAREAIAALEGGSYFLGVTTTALTDQATTNPITISGESVTAKNGNIAVYGNKEFVFNGTKWFEFGDLSTLGALAYKDSVSLNKGSGDNVLGEATTFTAAASAVSFSGGTTDTFVKGVTAETGNKLVTTSVPNVTSAGTASTWGFGLGSGADAETLIISGANGTAPTLGSAITAATGEVSASGTGSAVVTDVTIGASATAVTSIGTATAAAQTITVGSNDKVKVAQFNDLSVSTS